MEKPLCFRKFRKGHGEGQKPSALIFNYSIEKGPGQILCRI
ncbi:hypothetical protein CLOM621_05576 [Clostridium sp. M62/1]|nr:hypothetical protein CLOM621_05576 [Clostridium sp. M62/1]